MKQHLKIVRLKDRTPEWYAFRKNGIGGSEIAAILNLDEYKSRVRVFYEKVGKVDPFTSPNKHTHWGVQMEDLIAENWQYYDGTDEGYLDNYFNQNIQRKCKNINGYVINPTYQHMFVNLDRVINKGQFRLDDKGKLTEAECPLEIKTVHPNNLSKYEAGLPIAHIAQIHQQMVITETDYAEIAIFDCMRNLLVFEIPYSKEFAEGMIEASRVFWYDMVLPARELFEEQKKAQSDSAYEKIETQIAELEPEPDSTEDYEAFMKDMYKREEEVVKGEDYEYLLAEKYEYLKEVKKALTSEMQNVRNHILSSMRKATVMDFGAGSKVTYKANSKGSHIFRTSLKNISFSQDKIKEVLSKL